MTIPTKPIELNIKTEDLTLDELCLFEKAGFSVVGFRTFLYERTNWTTTEVGQLQVKDLKEVAEQIGAKLKADAAIPLATS